ncbi:UPF0193 protein EVG1, partial [Clarias magur]
MQLQEMEDEVRFNSGGLLCKGEFQTVLKMCAVKLVDIRNIQGQNVQLMPEDHLTGGEPGLTDGDQETQQAQLKMSSVRLVDFLKDDKAEDEPENKDQEYNNSNMSMSSNKSISFDVDQQKLHNQLKIVLVRLVDCGKIHTRNAAAEEGPEDRDSDHECENTDLMSSSKSGRLDGDQETMQAQLKMSSVRLVDCRKMQKRKPDDEIHHHDSKNNDFIPSSKACRFDGDQRTFEAQLKVCLVRLVDCGKKQSRKATAECEPKEGGALPMTCNTSSPATAQPVPKVSKGPVLPSRPLRRSAENCRAGDNYTPERFRPSATRDLEKEKRRLQNILATGQEDPQPSSSHTRPDNRKEDATKDRFQEVLDEIEERRQFLEEMTSLGRGAQYQHIINSEISQ